MPIRQYMPGVKPGEPDKYIARPPDTEYDACVSACRRQIVGITSRVDTENQRHADALERLVTEYDRQVVAENTRHAAILSSLEGLESAVR